MTRSTPELEQSTRADLAVRFQKIKAVIHRQLVEGLDLSRLHQLKPERLRREVRELAMHMSQTTPEKLDEAERERLVEEIMDEAFGLGPLEAAMKDPTVSDILVNGPREVFLERGGRLELSNIVFADDAHVLQVIQRVAARVGRRVDEMSPMVDARLPDGSRVNAIIPPLALNGPVLSVRRFGVRLNADDLIHIGSMPADVLTLLSSCVQGRLNVLISGGTGSGKTTFLNTLSAFIPLDERLVTIEDAAELKLQRPHVVRLETRPSNVEGSGEVRQRELVRNSLRMRPDRIIIGEVRGPEALDMLQAMNTGHEGSLTTIHANDTLDALSRLEIHGVDGRRRTTAGSDPAVRDDGAVGSRSPVASQGGATQSDARVGSRWPPSEARDVRPARSVRFPSARHPQRRGLRRVLCHGTGAALPIEVEGDGN